MASRMTYLELQDFFAQQIVLFDGAMGSQLQTLNLTAADFGGEELMGCNENLVRTRPDVIAKIHQAYFDAGADVVETNSFGSTPLVLGEYNLFHDAYELSHQAAALARKVANTYTDRRRFVAGSMGPTTRSLSVTGGLSFHDLAGHYAVQAEGLMQGGADFLLLETSLDTLNVKAGLHGIELAEAKLGWHIPVMLSCTIEQTGTMLAGQTADAFALSMEYASYRRGGLLSVGLNCATGPDAMADHVHAMASVSPFAISCMPNAGLPNEDGHYLETPSELARKLARFCDKGLLNIVGGCCGTTPAHITALRDVVSSYKPRVLPHVKKTYVTGIDTLDIDAVRPLIVGERTNVIGSRAFKKLIVEEKFDEAAEIARKQVRGGAHIIDICLANPDRDEQSDMEKFLAPLLKMVRAPLMIDSTDEKVMEAALQRIQGKSVVNSINLEDGIERFDAVCPLLKKYGAAVVVGCIDEDPTQGMAVTVERKVEIAERSHHILTKQYGIPEEDIIFDALVFPCGTGDVNYIGSAKQTIDGIRAIKERLPRCKTILGISNISFGLPEAGREALNTVFLHKNFEAGLDMAIVNSEKLKRITQLDTTEVQLCERLLMATPESFETALSAFTAHYKDQKIAPIEIDQDSLSVPEKLSRHVVEGSKHLLTKHLDLALQEMKPMDIINGPLLDGMAEVGKLFGNNQLIVAEVLQSAEVMKTAVNYLEPHMEKSSATSKGTMVLATVRGDVHDIGKNLVDIILSNNGFEIINLGIKIPPAQIIAACKEHKPDMIGLSGLLVKSAQEMVTTAEELAAAGIRIPILVGGAALTERFTLKRIAASYEGLVVYARDAMTGLDIANSVVHHEKRAELEIQVEKKKQLLLQENVTVATPQDLPVLPVVPVTQIEHHTPPPMPPDIVLHTNLDEKVEMLWEYINPAMLYTRHLGLRGKMEQLLAQEDAKAIALKRTVDEVKEWILQENILQVKWMYRFFPVSKEQEDIVLWDTEHRTQELARFRFLRQENGEKLCLSDFVPETSSTMRDHIALFVTTCQGRDKSVRLWADELKEAGRFVWMHTLQALAIETAEATAEWLHEHIRRQWGFPDTTINTKQDLFSARYRGKRYSFGYPACPRLEDQEILWKLLQPSLHLGVELTDGYMMDPEASVSAMVMHHPQARYFSVQSYSQV